MSQPMEERRTVLGIPADLVAVMRFLVTPILSSGAKSQFQHTEKKRVEIMGRASTHQRWEE